MTNETIKTSLDDLVSLLLQGQAPFDDQAFVAAAHFYRTSTPGGAATRTQVNLAACLYLDIKGERITEPRLRDLGAWGQRNAVLADIASFTRGRRPVTSVGSGRSLMALGAPPADVLQIAVSQGLDAAQKALEGILQDRFDKRIDEIQALADQRVLAAERNTMAATELKEAAQAESRMLEQKFDQAITGRTELSNRAAAAEARAGELSTQVAAITTALSEANAQAQSAQSEVSALRDKVEGLLAKSDADRKESMLAIDRARHNSDQLLSTQQGEISRLAGLLEKSQAAGEEHAQAARRAEAEVASTRAELAAAVDKIGDLQDQIEALTAQVSEAQARAGRVDEVLAAIGEARADVIRLGEAAATSEEFQSLSAILTEVSDSVQGLNHTMLSSKK